MELAVVCVIIKVANGTEVVETKLQPTVAAIVGNLHTEGGGGGGGGGIIPVSHTPKQRIELGKTMFN